jgi:hypothetical protein
VSPGAQSDHYSGPTGAITFVWHCASALGGASGGQPGRMQLCGQRRAATIGVIQMSPYVQVRRVRE